MELEAAAVAFFPAADGNPEPVGKLDVKDPGSPDRLSLVAAVTTATSQTRHPSRACTGDVQETEVKADLPRLHLTLTRPKVREDKSEWYSG
uniref:Uncharacterized protein n=1 Tax=Oryza glumipatula TaxID=40148 RepID=A0A0E0A3K3_9ORYZ